MHLQMIDPQSDFANDGFHPSEEDFNEKIGIDLDEEDAPYYPPEESQPPHY